MHTEHTPRAGLCVIRRIAVLAVVLVVLVQTLQSHAAGVQWTMLLNQTLSDASEAGGGGYTGYASSDTGFRVTQDLLGQTNVGKRGSVADDFEIPPDTSCTKLLVGLHSMREWSDNAYGDGDGDNCTGGAVQCTWNRVRNPSYVRFGILPDNATTQAKPAWDSALLWLNVEAPIGNWTNMTDFGNTGYHYGRTDMLDWFELDLTSLNNGTGLVPGRYWLLVSAVYIEVRFVYFSAQQTGYRNFYSLFQIADRTGAYNIYGAPAQQPVPSYRFIIGGPPSSNSTWSNIWDPVDCQQALTAGYKCGISMRIVGECTTTNPSVAALTTPFPPPVCSGWTQGLPWKCPLSSNTTTSTTTLPPSSTQTSAQSPPRASPVSGASTPVTNNVPDPSSEAPMFGFETLVIIACLAAFVSLFIYH